MCPTPPYHTPQAPYSVRPCSPFSRQPSASNGPVSLSSHPGFGALAAELYQEKDDGTIGAGTNNPFSEQQDAMSAEDVKIKMDKVDDVSSKLGQYMMKGWTLLDQHCPKETCSCPLVKSREGTTLCVSCGQEGTENEEHQFDQLQEPIRDNSGDSLASIGSVDETTDPALEAELRKQLLSNSAMRGAHEKTGRVRHPSFAANSMASPSEQSFAIKQRTLSFGFNDLQQQQQQSSGAMDVRVPGERAVLRPAPVQTQKELAPSKAEQQRSNGGDKAAKDTSALLGEKMLKGWKLLGVHCPNATCVCPLVQNKQGKMMCVQCGSVVVREEDFDPKKHRLAQNQAAAAAAGQQLNDEGSPVHKTSVPQTPAPTPRLDPSSSGHSRNTQESEMANYGAGSPGPKRVKLDRSLSQSFSNIEQDSFAIRNPSADNNLRVQQLNGLGVDPRLIAAASNHGQRVPVTPRTSLVCQTPPTTPATFQTKQPQYSLPSIDPVGSVVFHEGVGMGGSERAPQQQQTRHRQFRRSTQEDTPPLASHVFAKQMDGAQARQSEPQASSPAEAALQAKLQQASTWLQNSNDINQTMQVAALITSLATALKAIREL